VLTGIGAFSFTNALNFEGSDKIKSWGTVVEGRGAVGQERERGWEAERQKLEGAKTLKIHEF